MSQINQLSFIFIISWITITKSAISSTDTTTFEVINQVGGDNRGAAAAAARIGTYTFDKIYNNVAAFTNGKSFIFYGGDNIPSGWSWQWNSHYETWAGQGPTLDTISSAVDFTNFKLFSSNVYPHDSSTTSPPFNVISGSVSANLGIYTYDREWNGIAAYSNGNCIIYYAGSQYGWQWGSYYSTRYSGPHPPDVPSARAYLLSMGYVIETYAPTQAANYCNFYSFHPVKAGHITGPLKEKGVTTTISSKTTPDYGLIFDCEVTGTGCNTESHMFAFISDTIDYNPNTKWEKIRYTLQFWGGSACWSILGNKKYGSIPFNTGLIEFDVNNENDKIIANKLFYGSWHGETWRCDNANDNFWYNHSPNGYYYGALRVEQRRNHEVEEGSVGFGVSCASEGARVKISSIEVGYCVSW